MYQKEQNPFKVPGIKDLWDKLQDQGKAAPTTRFPPITGMEPNQMLQMQKLQADKTQANKQDFINRISKGDFIYRGKTNKLDIVGMYYNVDKVKQYKSRMEIADPINTNLLQHKLEKAIDNAAFLWGGKQNLKDEKTNNSFDRSMNDLLNHSKLNPVRSQSTLKGKCIFTKSHIKIKLEHRDV